MEQLLRQGLGRALGDGVRVGRRSPAFFIFRVRIPAHGVLRACAPPDSSLRGNKVHGRVKRLGRCVLAPQPFLRRLRLAQVRGAGAVKGQAAGAAIEVVREAPEVPVNPFPGDALVVQAAHELGQGPAASRRVARHQPAGEVHGDGRCRAPQLRLRLGREGLQTVPAGADAVGDALLALTKVHLDALLVELAEQLVALVPGVREHLGLRQRREPHQELILDAAHVDGHADDLREVRRNVLEAELGEGVHLQKVRANQDADDAARVQLGRAVHGVHVLHEPLKDVHVAVHADVHVVLGRILVDEAAEVAHVLQQQLPPAVEVPLEAAVLVANVNHDELPREALAQTGLRVRLCCVFVRMRVRVRMRLWLKLCLCLCLWLWAVPAPEPSHHLGRVAVLRPVRGRRAHVHVQLIRSLHDGRRGRVPRRSRDGARAPRRRIPHQ
mmetsp:Transcript_36502/g.114418  ORF Transcript_36502/g.114418 Transcript_36502/m.114418 type:complete len:440 (-) Transcript_36502:827-2146(-)